MGKYHQLASELNCPHYVYLFKITKAILRKNRKQLFLMLETFKVREEKCDYLLQIVKYSLPALLI